MRLRIPFLLGSWQWLASLALAAITFTNPSFDGIRANSPFTITWSGAEGVTQLELVGGPSLAELQQRAVLGCMFFFLFLWEKNCDKN